MPSIPFEYECKREAGFVMHPGEFHRIGYVTTLNGFGLAQPLGQDLMVSVPYNLGEGGTPVYGDIDFMPPYPDAPTASANVVGVIEKFFWLGGVCDPLNIVFYVSQENAMQVMALQQQPLTTTLISELGWWIAAYDQEVKKWFEQSYPSNLSTIAGHLNGKEDPVLKVSPSPVPAKDGIDVNVYQMTIEIVPACIEVYPFFFASSQVRKVTKSWGVVIGGSSTD